MTFKFSYLLVCASILSTTGILGALVCQVLSELFMGWDGDSGNDELCEIASSLEKAAETL